MNSKRVDKSVSEGASRKGRIRGALPVLLVSLTVALFVNLFIQQTRNRVDTLTEARLELSSMQDNVTDLAASENDLFNPYSAKEKVFTDTAKYETKARTTLGRIETLEGHKLPRIREALNTFATALNTELDIVSHGHVQDAAARDSQCDVLEEATDTALDQEGQRLGTEAISAGRLANASSFALITFVALCGALGFLRLEGTRRKIAQTQARKSAESRFGAIIRNAPVMISLLDDQKRFSFVSEGVRLVSSWTPEDLVGDTAVKFLLPGEEENFLRIFEEVINEEGKSQTFETRVAGFDGSTIIAEITLNNLMSETDVRGVSLICRDITKRNNALNEISAARDKALEAMKAKSEFLANMSHEIRTPMNGVIGMVDIMLDTPLNGDQKRFMEIVRTSAESLLSIINSILDFSKTEAGKLELELAPVSLRCVVEDIADEMAIQAHGKNVEVVVRAPSHSEFFVLADALRVRQILTNLAGNALKFTDSGEIVLGLKKLSETISSITVRLSVEDTGIGINEENQAKIFEVFTQADGSMTRKYGGTGLGLSISQAMANLMGSSVQCKSKEGEGSCFWMDVTLEKSAVEAQLDATPIVRLDGLKALIVDDNSVNRQILTEFLISWGCDVSLAEGGMQACRLVAQAKDRPFNLILLDYQMPGMDGFETAQRISAMGFNSIILMLSSVDANQLQGQLADIGIRERLVKPVRKDQLLNAITKALEDDSSEILRGPSPSSEVISGPVNMRVLLVEDNPTNQIVGSLLLKKLGCEVQLVQNGLEAIMATDSKDYDVILMDCEMPIMNGYEATAKIRERELFTKKHVPIVALTAHALTGIRENCLNAGMDGYLTKPITLEGLLEGLRPWAEPMAA